MAVELSEDQTFKEEDGYKGAFCVLYTGHSLHGECHYYTYARFHVTRGIDIVRHVTDLDKGKHIADPPASITQHISLGPQELEALFSAYHQWSKIDQDIERSGEEH